MTKLQITSFKITDYYKEGLERLVEKGIFTNVSEAIRSAVYDLLKRYHEIGVLSHLPPPPSRPLRANGGNYEKMRLVTVHLPKPMLETIDKLVEEGRYPSRSEAIRAALRLLIKREIQRIPRKYRMIGP